MSETDGQVRELTAEQREALSAYRKEVCGQANSTERCKRDLVESALRTLYGVAEYAPPAIVWCDSPSEAALMPLVLEALLLPEQMPIARELLGQEMLDSLLVKLCAQYDRAAFDGYETLLRPCNRHVSGQLVLMRKFNEVLRKRALKRLEWKYKMSVVSGAHSEIAEKLQGPLLRDCLSRTDAVRATLAQGLNRRLNLRTKLGVPLGARRLWAPPDSDDSRAYLAMLGTSQDPRCTGNVPFSASALDAESGFGRPIVLRAEAGRSKGSEAAFSSLSLGLGSVHFGWSSIPWLAHHDFARRHIDASIYADCEDKLVNAWWQIALTAWAYSCHEFVCFVSERPLSLHFDGDNRLHHPSEPAAVFADGSRTYMWHGTPVPSYVIEKPETITAASIDTERNSEVRRVMLERLGIDRYLRESDAVKIHEDDFGTLVHKYSTERVPVRSSSRIRFEEVFAVLKVVNSSPEPDGSFKEYFLRVPPNIRTAKEAVAWTFGIGASEYDPIVET